MEGGFDEAVMQGVVVYMLLLAYMVLGGVSFWFRYRFFGTTLIVGSVLLLAWFVARDS